MRSNDEGGAKGKVEVRHRVMTHFGNGLETGQMGIGFFGEKMSIGTLNGRT